MPQPSERMRNEIQAFADMNCDEGDSPSERSFILLCRVAGHVLMQYHEENPPDTDNPDTFTPQTLGGTSYGFALMQGLTENMEIDYPDDEFRKATL